MSKNRVKESHKKGDIYQRRKFEVEDYKVSFQEQLVAEHSEC